MPDFKKIQVLEISPDQFLNNCSPSELREIDRLIQGTFYTRRMNSRQCRECGCTDYDNFHCVKKLGEPCHWVEENLCSSCSDPNILKEE